MPQQNPRGYPGRGAPGGYQPPARPKPPIGARTPLRPLPPAAGFRFPGWFLPGLGFQLGYLLTDWLLDYMQKPAAAGWTMTCQLAVPAGNWVRLGYADSALSCGGTVAAGWYSSHPITGASVNANLMYRNPNPSFENIFERWQRAANAPSWPGTIIIPQADPEWQPNPNTRPQRKPEPAPLPRERPRRRPDFDPDAPEVPEVPADYPAPSPNWVPEPWRFPMAEPIIEAPPMIDPWSAPIRSPVTSPTHIPIPWYWIPWRAPHPGASPSEQPQVDPRPRPPRPPKPPEPPGPTMGTRPGLRGRPRPRDRRREDNAPAIGRIPQVVPGPRTKEKKPSRKRRVLARPVSSITELTDLLNCAWNALPEKFRKHERAKRHGKSPTAFVKAQQVYANLGAMNVDKFVQCAATDAAQDLAIARLSHGAQDLARATGRSTGYGVTQQGKTSLLISESERPEPKYVRTLKDRFETDVYKNPDPFGLAPPRNDASYIGFLDDGTGGDLNARTFKTNIGFDPVRRPTPAKQIWLNVWEMQVQRKEPFNVPRVKPINPIIK